MIFTPVHSDRTYDHSVAPLRFFEHVSPGYFHAMGTRILAGRDFTWDDQYGTRDVAIISETMAREEWGSPAAAVVKSISQMSAGPWQKVIGVVEDVRQDGVDRPAPAAVYWTARRAAAVDPVEALRAE
jgi:putative ABC transport system permease protein